MAGPLKKNFYFFAASLTYLHIMVHRNGRAIYKDKDSKLSKMQKSLKKQFNSVYISNREKIHAKSLQIILTQGPLRVGLKEPRPQILMRHVTPYKELHAHHCTVRCTATLETCALRTSCSSTPATCSLLSCGSNQMHQLFGTFF